tara:strand:+ start:22 stop:762 length:741 start_codon:yes stop_codon:yes gene_type:complete
MASRIEELFQDLAESVSGFGESYARGNQQQRQYERNAIDTSDLIKDDAMLLAGLGTAATLPYAGPAWLAKFASRATGPIINKAYGAVGGDMVNQTIRNIGNKLPGRSGVSVGNDATGRFPQLKAKAPAPTVRGPRGNTNIDVPQQRQLPLENARNTGGLNTTEQAAIKSQIGAKTSADEGIMNTPRGKSYMEELGDVRELERMNNRRNFLLTKTRYDQGLIKANEAPSRDFNKNLEELQRLEELLK